VWGRCLGFHDGNQTVEIGFNFTGLRNATKYKLYLVGISDNPRFLINRTNITKLEYYTNDISNFDEIASVYLRLRGVTWVMYMILLMILYN